MSEHALENVVCGVKLQFFLYIAKRPLSRHIEELLIYGSTHMYVSAFRYQHDDM